jgi:hypothetical protein
MAESIRKDLVWKNAFGDVSWQTLIKYGVMGTAVLGTSYFLVRTITRKPPMNAKGKKQKRKEDLSAPTFGSSVRSSSDLARDGVEVRPNSLASRSNTTSVSQLCLYPLKSCRGILVNSFYCGEMGAELNTEHGVVRDRYARYPSFSNFFFQFFFQFFFPIFFFNFFFPFFFQSPKVSTFQ